MPVKQHVQEIGGQEGGWGLGGGPLLSLWLCCAGAKDPGTLERGPPLCLVTPGSGCGPPFCSRWRWGPGTSTHPVCHTTLGKESPDREKTKRSLRKSISGLTSILNTTQMGIKWAKSGHERDIYIPSHVARLLRLRLM